MMTQLERTMPGETIGVQADERTRSVIVTARASTFQQIEGIIKTLDRVPSFGEADVIIVPLKNADAGRLAAVLTAMLKPDAAGQVTPEALALQEQVRRLRVRGTVADNLPELDLTKPIKITADPARPQGSNSLLISSTPENLKAMRAIVESLDIVPLAENTTVRLLILQNADAQSVMLILRDVFAQGVRLAGRPGSAAFGRAEPENAAGKALVNPLNVSADTRTNAIILSGQQESVALAETLVGKLDTRSLDPAVQMAIIPMKHNDAGVVGQMVSQLFAARKLATTPRGQPPLPRENVDIVADSLTNSMIVSASKENMEMIRGLVEKLDIEPPDKTGVVRMVPLKNSDATRVASMLEGLVRQGIYKPGMLAAGANPAALAREKVAIAADVRTNVLILSASKENFAVLEEILRTIDSSADYALNGDVRLFPLKNADATRLAPTLERLFREKLAAEQAAGGAGRSLAVSVAPDARTNTLLVTGGRETFGAIEQMIKQLDAAAQTATNQFRVFKLKYATAAVLQSTLDRLFRQRNVREPQRDTVTVVADPVANALIVGATADDMKAVEDLLARLDTAKQQADWTVEVFPLADADATQLAETIRGLDQARGTGTGGTGGGGLIVSADPRTNALIVTGGPADIQRISELVGKLDSKNLTKVTQIRVYPLAHADAEELARLLTDSLTKTPPPVGAGSPARQTLLQFIRETPDGRKLIETALQEGILISADKRANSLLVLAPAPLVPLLRNLITALDEASPQAAQIRVFALQNADARQMADVLTQLFRLQRGPGAAGGAGDRAVRYTLVAPKAAEGAAADKAAPAPVAEKPAADTTATLGSAEQYALSVTVDVRTNSLLIGGTLPYITLASQVIQSLDCIPAQERLTKVYRLRNAQAKDIQAALQTFLDRERQKLIQVLGNDAVGAAQRLLEREVAVVAETTSNTLLLSASPKYFQTVAAMIDELDQPPPQVLVQCLLAEVALDDSTDLGFEWMFSSTHRGTTYKVGTDFGVAAAWAKTGGLNLSITGGDLTFFLRALQSQGRLEVLSRPQILAVDNQQSQINIGERVPFISSSRITETGSVLNTIQYEQVGVILKVTPRINPDGLVRLEVHPEISEVAEATVKITEGLNAIRITSRTADTTVTVQDGHTVVIGGLITTRDSARDNKVPLLGDIPLLGALFKSTTRVKKRTELMIILTPHVLRNARQADWLTERNLNRVEAMRDKAARTRNTVKEFFLGRPKESPLLAEPQFVPLDKMMDLDDPMNPRADPPASRPAPPGPSPTDPVDESEYR
jgi:type II secretion system protein D